MEHRCGVWTRATPICPTRSPLESGTIESDSLVVVGQKVDTEYPEYGSSDLESEDGSYLDPILNKS